MSIMIVDMSQTGACRIHLVRHGTTTLNVENRYRGRLDVDLDEQGWEDARVAAAELAGAGLAAIYTSPLKRARDTAQTVADAGGVARVIDAHGLINLDYGQWDALTPAEAAALDAPAYVAYQAFDDGATCPGGESLEDAANRMVAALCGIGRRHPGKQVAAVSHAAMVRLALVTAMDGPRRNWRLPLANGSITVFDVVDGRLTVPASVAGRARELRADAA
jgi:broad specificity phosphatase PhoE